MSGPVMRGDYSAGKVDTSTLGPVRVDSTKTPVRAACDRWYAELGRQGDPMRRPHLVGEAFAAGAAWAAANRVLPPEGCLPADYVSRLSGTVVIDDQSEPGSWRKALGEEKTRP